MGTPDPSHSASTLQLLGAGAFGALIGWYVYSINRYRKEEAHLGDVVTLVGVLGGSGVLALFEPRSDLFGAYGIGLFVGFFGYLITLILLVSLSRSFGLEWFLDGRRKRPAPDEYVPEDSRGSGTGMATPAASQAPPSGR